MLKKFEERTLIVGLGYVGLTLALALADKGKKVWGFDTNKEILKTLKNKRSHVYEKNIDKILKKNFNKNFFLVNRINSDFDNIIVTVGTPVKNKKADLSYIKDITHKLAKIINKKTHIIFRSTIPIGTCNNVIIPIFKKYKMRPGKDFDISFAPERTIEGNALYELKKLPQIISGYNSNSLKRCENLFSTLTKKVIKVKNFESAEIIKLINNSYRDLSFAYSNQIALICCDYNLSANMIIKDSNKDYPRNIIPVPSPGVGGPCLTKDPYILGKEIKSNDKNIFEIGRSINNKIVKKLISVIKKNITNQKEKILICGLSFKGFPETKDYRGSGTLTFLKDLKSYNVELFDPLYSSKEIRNLNVKPFKKKNKFFDKLIILNNNKLFKTNHFQKNILKCLKDYSQIYDYWNIFNKKLLKKNVKYFQIGQN